LWQSAQLLKAHSTAHSADADPPYGVSLLMDGKIEEMLDYLDTELPD
jgi:hypothetical protein